jgi:nicotinate-nucleotide pyrophosphorylase (carboxylating)
MAEVNLVKSKERIATLLDSLKLDEIIRRALDEDLGSGDITTNSIFSNEVVSASLLAKESGIISGLSVFKRVFEILNDEISFNFHFDDGDRIVAGEIVAKLQGLANFILEAERTALNLLQRMSGIATLSAKYVEAVSGTGTKILDTRKTIPGLRILDKYAVRSGGAHNHRMGLYDGALIKDNHIVAAGGIEQAVAKVRSQIPPIIKIEVETTNLAEVQQAIESDADIIMLDNMSPGEMKEAVQLIDRRALTEASGGITLTNIREVAETGVDYISIGALTHSVKALDLSLEVEQL